MNLTKRILTASLAVAATLGVVPAATAQAATSVNISYRDGYRDYRDYRGHDRRDFRRDQRRNWDRDRDGIPNRYDRYDNRRNWGYNGGHRYRDNRRCWTQWQYNRWQDRRVPVRVCR